MSNKQTISPLHGKNADGEFFQHNTREGMVVIQTNRHFIWHAYIGGKWNQSFTDTKDAMHWFNERCKTDVKLSDPLNWRQTQDA